MSITGMRNVNDNVIIPSFIMFPTQNSATAFTGNLRFNVLTNKHEYYNGTSWASLSGSVGVHSDLSGLDADDHTQYYNSTRLTAALANYVTNTSLTSTLANYPLTTAMNTAISSALNDYVTVTTLSNIISDMPETTYKLANHEKAIAIKDDGNTEIFNIKREYESFVNKLSFGNSINGKRIFDISADGVLTSYNTYLVDSSNEIKTFLGLYDSVDGYLHWSFKFLNNNFGIYRGETKMLEFDTNGNVLMDSNKFELNQLVINSNSSTTVPLIIKKSNNSQLQLWENTDTTNYTLSTYDSAGSWTSDLLHIKDNGKIGIPYLETSNIYVDTLKIRQTGASWINTLFHPVLPESPNTIGAVVIGTDSNSKIACVGSHILNNAGSVTGWDKLGINSFADGTNGGDVDISIDTGNVNIRGNTTIKNLTITGTTTGITASVPNDLQTQTIKLSNPTYNTAYVQSGWTSASDANETTFTLNATNPNGKGNIYINNTTDGNVFIGRPDTQTSTSTGADLYVSGIVKADDFIKWVVSDNRLKKNITPIGCKDAYDKLISLNLYTFDYRKRYNLRKRQEFGFIAQDMEKIDKFLVHTTEFRDIKDCKIPIMDNLIPYLVATCKYLAIRVDDLEKQRTLNNSVGQIDSNFMDFSQFAVNKKREKETLKEIKKKSKPSKTSIFDKARDTTDEDSLDDCDVETVDIIDEQQTKINELEDRIKQLEMTVGQLLAVIKPKVNDEPKPTIEEMINKKKTAKKK